MDKHQQRAAENKPFGYFRVRSGIVEPSDLVYSWPTGEYLRADDENWLQPTPKYASICVYVLREGNEPERKAKPPEIVEDVERSGDRQLGLF